jgi:hypothetical protein
VLGVSRATNFFRFARLFQSRTPTECSACRSLHCAIAITCSRSPQFGQSMVAQSAPSRIVHLALPASITMDESDPQRSQMILSGMCIVFRPNWNLTASFREAICRLPLALSGCCCISFVVNAWFNVSVWHRHCDASSMHGLDNNCYFTRMALRQFVCPSRHAANRITTTQVPLVTSTSLTLR